MDNNIESKYFGPKAGSLSAKGSVDWAEDFGNEFASEIQQDEDARVAQDALDSSVGFDARVAKDLQSTASQIASIQDPKFRQSELFKMMNAISNGEITFQGDKVVPLPPDQKEAMDRLGSTSNNQSDKVNWADQFESESRPGGVWQREFEEAYGLPNDNQSSSSSNFPQANVSREWEAQFSEFDKKFAESWAKDFEQAFQGGLSEEGDYDDPDFAAALNRSPLVPKEYQLNETNAFEGDSAAFEKGIQFFKAGRLLEAIEAFEAAVKQKPDHSLAWQMLGASQAENDRDDLASLALLKAVQVDPENRDALITLAVSYTNDFHKHRALECLQQWLSSNPAYQQIDSNRPLTDDFDHNHDYVTDLFIQAARTRPHDPDPDVQVALGLLYNLTFDYAKAIDCFKAAAMKRPDDYLIWNKLGATQANSKNSQEAIDSYIRALEIKPSYTRACSNLGISFMALNEYGEAAKAFLSALTLNPTADHQWDNLRNVFSLMRRPDLLKKCDTKDISLFMDEFHF